MGLLLIPFFAAIAYWLNGLMARRHRWFDAVLMNRIFWFHLFMSFVYYGYSLFESSDSRRYFLMTSEVYTSWGQSYRTGTQFIHFIGYPFIHFLGFDYTMMMSLFAFLGYLGFVYFYCFFRENMIRPLKWKGLDLATVLMVLPNMHFWTASFGKGPPIFLGLGMVAYSLANMRRRLIPLGLGLMLIYHVRPHIFLFTLLGLGAGYFLGSGRKVPVWQKIVVVGGSVVAMVLMFDQIAAIAGLDSETITSGGFDRFANQRAAKLSRSGSGVDVSNYPLLLKLITFWFRPLFIDAPGILGLIVSVENTIYVLLTLELFKKGFIKWFIGSEATVKVSIVLFVTASIALSTTMANLGIIIRQKSQVMYFYFLPIVAWLNHQEIARIRAEIVMKKKKMLVLEKRRQARRVQQLNLEKGI